MDLNLPLGFREPQARRKELPKKKRRTGYCSAFLLLPIDSRDVGCDVFPTLMGLPCVALRGAGVVGLAFCCSRLDVLVVIPRSDDTMFWLLVLASSSLFLLARAGCIRSELPMVGRAKLASLASVSLAQEFRKLG